MEEREKYFLYGEKETSYLSSKDKRLGRLIKQVGHLYRPLDPSLYLSIINKIISQQISNKALATVWKRFCSLYLLEEEKKRKEGDICKTLSNLSAFELHKVGISIRKAEYIIELSRKIEKGEFTLSNLSSLSCEALTEHLTRIRGIGKWSVQMVLLFYFNKMDIFSYSDAAVKSGLALLHNLNSVTKECFTYYKSLYSPYGSVASLYLWEVSNKKIRIEGDKEG